LGSLTGEKSGKLTNLNQGYHYDPTRNRTPVLF